MNLEQERYLRAKLPSALRRAAYWLSAEESADRRIKSVVRSKAYHLTNGVNYQEEPIFPGEIFMTRDGNSRKGLPQYSQEFRQSGSVYVTSRGTGWRARR